MRALSSFLFFIFFCGVSEPAEPDLNPTKSKVLSSLVAVVFNVTAKLMQVSRVSFDFNNPAGAEYQVKHISMLPLLSDTIYPKCPAAQRY